MKHTIDTKVLQAVLDYMANQPYKDTAPIIAQIQMSAKPVQEPKEGVQVEQKQTEAKVFDEAHS